MTNRDVIDEDWQPRHEAIRQKVEELCRKHADHPHISKLDPNEATWRDCKQAFDATLKALSAAQKAGKSFLGNYKEPVLYDWDRLLTHYAKGNIHLAEAARLIMQLVTYDITALKSQVQRNEKQINDSVRKGNELESSMMEQRSQRRQHCAALGIDGIDVRREILSTVATLPQILTDVHTSLRAPGLADATSIYSVFAAYSLRASASNEPSDASEFVPTLTQLLASPTPSIADDVVAAIKQISGASSAQDTDTAVEIDWSGQGDDTGVDIDWNLDMAPAAGGGEAVEEPAGGEIDWSAMIAADTVGDAGGADGGIVWDITETEPSSTTANGVDAAAALQGSGSEVASNQYGGLPVRSEPVDGSELLDLLQDEFRDRLLDDLEELSTFFSQRSIEIGRQSASGTFLVSASDAPDEVASLTLKRVDACLAAVEAAKSSLTDTAFFRMVMVSRQGPYLDRLVDSVARFDRTVDKYRQRELDLISQQQELSRQNQKLRTELEALVALAKESQQFVEQALSDHLRSPVKIIGKINSL